MRQLLMLGFYCEVYRREPRCRVYVNDVLLDEFDIPHTPRISTVIHDTNLDPAFYSADQFDLQFTQPLKFLELDDAGDRYLDLRIEIHNDDNNYVNGFMTRYTRVMLRQCWVAPVKILEQFDQIYDRWKYCKRNWQKYFGCKKIIDYYLGYQNSVLNNLARYADLCFPGITRKQFSIEQLKTRCSNYKDFPQLWRDFACDHWIGSSGYFRVNLVKKLGFWRYSTDRRRGWWKWSSIKDMKYFYDKYKQHEDQRSSNT